MSITHSIIYMLIVKQILISTHKKLLNINR